MDRISFEDLAIKFALSSAERSEDPYKKVGCSILNKEGRLLSIGYNGLTSKKEVNNSFWEDRDERRTYMIHAEVNALACISRYDNPYLIATSLLPCSACAINIVSYGIKKVLYLEEYHRDQKSLDIFKFYNIDIIKYNVK
jgi:dCMP deaminase